MVPAYPAVPAVADTSYEIELDTERPAAAAVPVDPAHMPAPAAARRRAGCRCCLTTSAGLDGMKRAARRGG